MTRNLILSGGPAHDYSRTSAMLSSTLAEVGVRSDIHEDFGVIESGVLREFDMITMNCARWTCADVGPDHEWYSFRFELSQEARAELLGFLGEGKGLLALHAATLCFDDWDEFAEILGARFTGHGPYQEYRLRVHADAHPITEGLADFDITDELYTSPRITDAVEPLVDGEWEGKMRPVLWVRDYRNSRVCYNALGHDVDTFANPHFQKLLRRGALWVTRRLGD